MPQAGYTPTGQALKTSGPQSRQGIGPQVLIARFPGLRAQLVEDDDIAPFVNVYVEGEDVRTLDGIETPVAFGSTVILLPAMAGGGA